MYDNDLFNQFSEAFHDMLDNLDKGLRDGVGELKDMKKNVERNGLFGEKKEKPKTNYRVPFANLTKNLSVPSIDNPFKKRKIAADVIRCDGVLTIRAELPGYEKSKIHVDYREGVIIIRAEREFKVGKIDVSTVRANYNNGILTVSCECPEDGSTISID